MCANVTKTTVKTRFLQSLFHQNKTVCFPLIIMLARRVRKYFHIWKYLGRMDNHMLCWCNNSAQVAGGKAWSNATCLIVIMLWDDYVRCLILLFDSCIIVARSALIRDPALLVNNYCRRCLTTYVHYLHKCGRVWSGWRVSLSTITVGCIHSIGSTFSEVIILQGRASYL